MAEKCVPELGTTGVGEPRDRVKVMRLDKKVWGQILRWHNVGVQRPPKAVSAHANNTDQTSHTEVRSFRQIWWSVMLCGHNLKLVRSS